jgi:putative FmdB family regulatory protein
VPVYDYRCEKGHRFEVVQSMSDKPLKKCEECGAPAQRVLHAPAIHFKGSGFHNTDYGTKSRAKEPAAASGGSGTAAPASGGSGGSGGSDSGSSGGGGKSVGLDKV